MVWGHGEKLSVGRHLREKQTLVVLTEDGSGVVSSVDFPNGWVKVYDFELGEVVSRPSTDAVRSGVAVDFSGASGADALVVVVGPCAGSGGTEIDVNGTSMRYLTLSGTPVQPEVRVTGDTLRIGNQSVHWDGQRFYLGTFSSDTTFYAGIDIPTEASSTVLRMPKSEKPISLHGNPWGIRELFDPAGRRMKAADVFRIPAGVLIGTTGSGKIVKKLNIDQ
jgi:WD40 repeat protein